MALPGTENLPRIGHLMLDLRVDQLVKTDKEAKQENEYHFFTSM